MYQRFLQNAARNALVAKDVMIYERAFALAAANLNGEQNVRALQMPTPAMLARMKDPLAFRLNMAELCTGLWLAEWALEHPAEAGGITWNYWPPLAQTVAQEIILEG